MKLRSLSQQRFSQSVALQDLDHARLDAIGLASSNLDRSVKRNGNGIYEHRTAASTTACAPFVNNANVHSGAGETIPAHHASRASTYDEDIDTRFS